MIRLHLGNKCIIKGNRMFFPLQMQSSSQEEEKEEEEELPPVLVMRSV